MQASKGTRIRQGAPDEDKALAAHVLELVPKDQLLSEAAQLCELLILLGHEADAGILQQVGSVSADQLSTFMLIISATWLCLLIFISSSAKWQRHAQEPGRAVAGSTSLLPRSWDLVPACVFYAGIV